MAGLRDTEASFEVQVNGIDKLSRLNEQFDKSVAAAEKLDSALNKGFNVSNSGSNSISRINEQLEKTIANATKLSEVLSKSGSSNANVAENANKASSAMQKQIETAEKIAASSSKIADYKSKEAAANDKSAISAEKVSQAQAKSEEFANKVAASAEKASQAQIKSAEMSAKLEQAQFKVSEYAVKAANAQDRETAAIEKSVAAADKLVSAREKDIALAEKYQAQTAAINNSQRSSQMYGGGSHGNEHRENRVVEAMKEGASMFAPGMLVASGVIKAAETVKDLFKEGAHYNSEVSGMGGTWQTLVDGARGEGVSAKEAGNSNDIVQGIQNTSRITGRSLGLVDEGYQQMYHATESADRTKHLVHSEMMIADAMNMSDAQASRFAMYGVGHSLDRGKVNGGAMNQMVQYAPALTGALTRAYLADTQKKKMTDISDKDVEHEKGELREHIKGSEVSAKMLEDALNYLGDDKFKLAAENAQKTIPGMVRAVKNGSGRIMGEFEKSFAEPISKHASSFFGGITKYVLSEQSTKDAQNAGAKLAVITAKVGDGLGVVAEAVHKLWDATSDFRGGFAKGFVEELNNVKNAVNDAGNFVGKMAKKVSDMLPKGASQKAKDFGELTGKVVAFLGVLKFASHLPVVGNVFKGVLGQAASLASKIPLIGGILSKIIGGNVKETAGAKMMAAADTMMAAAIKMNGGVGGTGSGTGGAYKKGRVVSGTGKFTLAEKLANSKLGAGVDGVFAKGAALAGKGGIKGAIGKGMMWGSSRFGGVLTGGAKMLSGIGSKVSGSRIGRIAGGTGKFIGGAAKLGKGIFSRGGGFLNAGFAGLDVYNTMRTTKSGTKARHEGVGSAVGGGIGGTIGAALGSFIGPVGTVAGGVAGSWLGNKAGGYVGSNWNGMMKGGAKAIKGAQSWGDKTSDSLMKSGNPIGAGFGVALRGMSHPIKSMNALRSGADRLGKSLEVLPFGKVGNAGVRAFTHPIESIKKFGSALSHPKKTFNDLVGGFKKNSKELGENLNNPIKAFQTLGKFGGSLSKNFKGVKVPKFLQKAHDGVDQTAQKLMGYGAKKNNPLAFAGGMALGAVSHPVKAFNKVRGGIDGLSNSMVKSKNPLSIAGGVALKGLAHPVKAFNALRSGADRFGKSLKALPFGDFADKAIRSFTHPIETAKGLAGALKNPKKAISDLGKGFKENGKKFSHALAHPMETLGSFGKSLKNNFSNIKVPNFLKGLFKMPKFKMPKLKMPKITMPKLHMPKLPKLSNPFKGWKLPKITMPKLPKITNPFKGWHLPKINMPKMPTISNPFKGWHLPKITMPKMPSIKNPFAGWKMPHISMPKLPKITNPFKNFKFPKITFPKLPDWLSKLNPFGGAKSSAKGANGEAKNVSKSASSANKHISKTGSSAKKAGQDVGKAFGSAFDKVKSGASKIGSSMSSGLNKAKSAAKSGAKGIGSSLKDAFKNVDKDAKSSFNKVSSGVKSGLNKAKSAAKSGAKGIATSVKSGFKSIGTAGKSEFSKLSSTVKSGMNKSKSAAKSGSKGIGTAVKSGLKSVGSAGKSEFNKLSSTVKSGINKAKSSAKSGSIAIGNAVKNGLKNVGNAGKSEFSKLSSSVTSGMNKAKSAATSGASGIGKAISSGMKNVSSAAKSAMNSFTSSVQSGISKAASVASSGTSKIVSSVSSGLSKLGSVSSSGFDKMSSSMSSAMSKVSSTATSGMAKVSAAVTAGMVTVTSAVQSGGTKAVSVMSSAFDKMASSGTSASAKVASSMSSIGSAASEAASRVNALAASINNLHSKTITITANVEGKGASKLATGTSLAKSAFSSIPAYAGGTPQAHKGGAALVNDSNTSDFREAFMLPNGKFGLFPNERNILVDLPKGTHVLNGSDTKRKFGSNLSRYANGTSGAMDAVNAVRNRNLKHESGSQDKKSGNVKFSVGKIEINITDKSGNAKDMADSIAREVEKRVEEIFRKFNSNYIEVGA